MTDAFPALLSVRPKLAMRAWLRWMADNLEWEFPDPCLGGAERVRMSIDTWVLNFGKEPAAEAWAKRCVEQELATFAASWRERRGQG